MQSSSSTHHHQKIKRTSIRTYYSNLDLSQTTQRNSRQHLYQQQQQPPCNERMQSIVAHNKQHRNQLQQSQPTLVDRNFMKRGQSYDYSNNYVDMDDEDFIDDMGNEADFEDLNDNQQTYAMARRNSIHPHRAPLLNHRHNTTSIMTEQPGQRKHSYVELMPNAMQTAKARIQNNVGYTQRIRSPSLPVIRHRGDYFNYNQQQQQQQQQDKIPLKLALTPHNSQLVTVDSGNQQQQLHQQQQHRLNNIALQQLPGNPSHNNNNNGCQEEDTSGYLSDSPKNIHTPNIWYNDGASQVESITSAIDSNSLISAEGNMEYGHRRNKRSIINQQQQQQQQQQQLMRMAKTQNDEQVLNKTYIVKRRGSQQHQPPQQQLVVCDNDDGLELQTNVKAYQPGG